MQFFQFKKVSNRHVLSLDGVIIGLKGKARFSKCAGTNIYTYGTHSSKCCLGPNQTCLSLKDIKADCKSTLFKSK